MMSPPDHRHTCRGCGGEWACSVNYCSATPERACWDCRVRGLAEDVAPVVAAVTRGTARG